MCTNDACRWDLFVRTSNTTTTSNEQTKKSSHEKGDVCTTITKPNSKPNIAILTWCDCDCDCDCDCSKGSMGNGQLRYPHLKWNVFLNFGCECCELNLFLFDDTFEYNMKQQHHHFSSNAFWCYVWWVCGCLVCVGEANSKQTFDYKNVALKLNGEYNELSSPTKQFAKYIYNYIREWMILCSLQHFLAFPFFKRANISVRKTRI